ncbi:hypothetical protein [Bacillus sp. T33-2]|uniref:hypothetical protein n=1 Tax=Bacillus sp. T33-2 TaxID=2054168 RepID=UPI000C7910BF|nr:hypothetical protein [Bacillus sp. T33-2]PLR93834.1 hypothetical protein CVD19_19125 [Bacillus sp. T33-2]
MDRQRKSIIVQEITYWKKNRLLPDQYCDYLLALYTGGDEPAVEPTSKKSGKMVFFSGSLLMLLPLSAFLIYFTELSFILQITFYILMAGICFGAVYYYSKMDRSIQLPMIVSALLLLMGSAEVADRLWSHPLTIYSVLALNCLVWTFTGLKLKLLSFKVSGPVGLLVLAVVMFR